MEIPSGSGKHPWWLLLWAGRQDRALAQQLGMASALVLPALSGPTAAGLLTDGTGSLLAQPACYHGNGRILLSYSLLTHTKPAASSSFA